MNDSEDDTVADRIGAFFGITIAVILSPFILAVMVLLIPFYIMISLILTMEFIASKYFGDKDEMD